MQQNTNKVASDDEFDSSEEKAFSARPSISIRTRLIIAFSLIFALCAIISIWSIITIDRVVEKIQFLETSDIYKAEIQNARRYEKNYLLYGTNFDDAVTHVENARLILTENAESIKNILGSPDFLKMKNLISEYHSLLLKLKNPGTGSNPKEVENQLRDAGFQMIETAQNFENIERKSVNNMLDLTRKIPFLFLFLLLLSMIFIAYFLARQLLGSLARFMKYTERIGEGDFSPIPPQRKYSDEFSQLRRAFNHMIKELDFRHKILAESHKLRAIGTLVAGVAHELNNPLNNTMLTAAMLQEDHKDIPEEEQIDMISDIIHETERSQKIVRNLLDFARESEIKLAPLKINHILEGSVNLVANQVRIHKINLTTNFAENLPPIHGDTQMLQQVFINLILNAVDALPEKGTITISTSRTKKDDLVVAEFKDNGPGIPEHILPRVFDPFFTTKPMKKGTGLGLSVSMGIIKHIGGYITAESKVGEGASFKVFLPVTNIPSSISANVDIPN